MSRVTVRLEASGSGLLHDPFIQINDLRGKKSYSATKLGSVTAEYQPLEPNCSVGSGLSRN